MAKSRTIQLIISAKDRASKVLKSIGGGLAKFGKIGLIGLGAVGAGVTALGAGLAVLYGKLSDQIDEQAKMASALGISNEKLGAFRDAAGYAGISTANLSTALRKMSQGVADAANGTGEAKDALEELGLDAEKLQQQGPEKAFNAIIEKLDEIPNGIKKTALAMDLFGRSGAAMTNLTSKGLQQAQTDADTLGVKLSTAQAAGVEAANDAWARIKNAATDFMQYIAATVAPKIDEGLTRAFSFLKKQDLKAWAERAGQSMLDLAKMMAATLPKVLIVILQIIGKIGMGIRGWQMLWQEAQIYALGFAASVQNIIKYMAEGFRQIFTWINFKGMFDGAVEGLQSFVDSQDQIISQLSKDRQTVISQQVKTISDYDKEQQAIDDYKKILGDMPAAFDAIGKEALKSADATETAESKKISALNSTTSAVNDQIAAFRRLQALQGKTSTGSFQTVSYNTGLEGLETALENEADK